MITAIVYLINSIVLAIFAYRILFSISKKYNPFLFYFFGTSFFYSLSLFLYFILITVSISQNIPVLLFWSDYIGRFFLYIGTAFAIQVPLYKFFPKSKKRYFASIIYALIGASLAIYNLYYPNHPFIDANGAIHWEADPILAGGLGLLFISVWVPTSIVFINEFVKSKFKSIKSFLLATGFLIGAISGAFQDYSQTPAQYIIVNLLLAVGFILILLGLFREE